MPSFEITITFVGDATYTIEAADEDTAKELVWESYNHADLEGSSDITACDEVDNPEELT